MIEGRVRVLDARRANAGRRLVVAAVLLSPFVLPVACSPLSGQDSSDPGPGTALHAFARTASQPESTVDPAQLTTTQPPALPATTAPPAPSSPTQPTAEPTTTQPTATTTPPAPPAPAEAPAPSEAPSATDAAPAPGASPFAARAVEGVSTDATRELASLALGLIVFDWQGSLPGWEVRFLDARAGYRGLTYPEERVIEVYVRAGDTPYSLAHVVAHEMGHAVDVTWFTDADRTAWVAARGLDSRAASWFVDTGGSDFASGAGDFAESFAWWQVGAPNWFGELAGPPTDAQLGVLAALVIRS